MLKPETIEGLRQVTVRLKAEREQITAAVEAIDNLLRVYGDPVTAVDDAPEPKPLRAHQSTRAPKRCSNCRSREHTIARCPTAGTPAQEQARAAERQAQREAIPPPDEGPVSSPPSSDPPPTPEKPLSWLNPRTPAPRRDLAPPEADGRVRVCPIHDGSRLSIARMQPNARPVYMCPMGHETTNSMLRDKVGA